MKVYNSENPLSEIQMQQVADFLVKELGEFGDSKEDVLKCLQYSQTGPPHPGGLVMVVGDFDKLEAILVVNHTGMSGYIPEHILVYFAVGVEKRGLGLGHEMLNFLLTQVQGGIALHVESSNPAKRLYERFGFTNKYLEMRLERK